MTSRLAGLTTIVTGASSGSVRGSPPGSSPRAPPSSPPAVARSPSTASWVETDVADAASCDALIAAAVDATGRLDTIVNNAGVQVEKPIEDTTDDDYDLVMNVNVRGVFNCCRAAVRQMATQRREGRSSTSARLRAMSPTPDGDLQRLKGRRARARAIATDNGHQGVRCNAISPGWIMTALADAAFDLADDPAAARAEATAAHPSVAWVRRTTSLDSRCICVGRRRLRDR